MVKQAIVLNPDILSYSDVEDRICVAERMVDEWRGMFRSFDFWEDETEWDDAILWDIED